MYTKTCATALALCLVAPAIARADPADDIAAKDGTVRSDSAATLASGLGRPGLAHAGGQIAAAYSHTTYRIQLGLNRLRYEAGPADGLMGRRTAEAIRAYQRDNRLLVTGQPSPGLLDHIERSIEEKSAAVDRPTEPSTADGSTEMVAGIQSQLRRRGYQISVVSGRLDAETRSAIRAYQQDAGLLVTGEPSVSLLRHMRARASGAEQDTISRQELVQRTQQALRERGYDPGPADGVMGPKTRDAIRTYQSDADLPLTGQVSTSLLAKLEGPASPDAGTGADSAQDDTDATGGERRFSRETRLFDDFSDGDLTSNPTWTVHAGQFSVGEAKVLRSRVRSSPNADNAPEPGSAADIGAQVLRGVLAATVGAGGAQIQGDRAQISSAAPFGNAWHIKMRLKSHLNDGRFIIGPYQGNVSSGYRLAYASGDRPSFELLSVSSGQVRVVEASDRMINLEDGQPHDIEWWRFPTGRMVVKVDGKNVVRARDNSFQAAFDGFTMTNAGGDYGVHMVQVDALKRVSQ